VATATVFDADWEPLILEVLMALLSGPFCLFMLSGDAATSRSFVAPQNASRRKRGLTALHQQLSLPLPLPCTNFLSRT
jgi:hypothetical protein